MALPAGTRLGSYEIVTQLGKGGMGEVYRARDSKLGRDVALKVLPAEAVADPERRARFEREARAASALTNPHICAVHDVGEDAGRPFLVMELLEGTTLGAHAAGRAIDADEVIRLGVQIADALEAAHAKGVVHRDIKPGNIMITAGRHLKVLDFGLARQIASETDRTRTTAPLTMAGDIFGTPHYMAPETLQGHVADARSDIWSVGVVLYELAAGRRPFHGNTPAATSAAILGVAPSRLPSDVPAALRNVIDRCLAKRPEDRFQSASDLRVALAAAQRSHTAPRRSKRAWLAGAAIVASAAIVVGAVTLWPRARPVDRLTSTGAHASASQDANDAFELAMQLQRVQNDIPRSNQLLERAIAIDPHFAEARRFHAFNYTIAILNGYSNDSAALYKAEEELRLAARDEPSLVSLPSAFTAVYLMQGRRELVPTKALDDAIVEHPDHRDATIWRAILAWLEEDHDTVKRLTRAALEREPLLAAARLFLGETLRSEGDIAGAIREQQKILDQAPANISAVRNLTMAYLDGADLQRADDLVESRRQGFAGNFSWRATRALVYAAQGKRSDASAAMDPETLKYLAVAFTSTLDGAEFYALAGDTDRAIEWIERAVRNGDERIQWFQRNRRLAAVWGDARFRNIIESVRARRVQRHQK